MTYGTITLLITICICHVNAIDVNNFNSTEFNKASKVTLDKKKGSHLTTQQKFLRLAHMEASFNDQQMPSIEALSQLYDSKISADKKIPIAIDNLFNLYYLGPLYLGRPQSMPVKIVYDTGSTWLAVKSEMCTDCESRPYKPNVSETAWTLGHVFSQAYGSADLKGIFYKDTVCLEDISNGTNSSNGTNNTDMIPDNAYPLAENNKSNKSEECVSNFTFIAITQMEGLQPEIHGIMGLSPTQTQKVKPQNSSVLYDTAQYLTWLHTFNVIDNQIVSFHLSDFYYKFPGTHPDQSYATFGGWNSSQFIGDIRKFDLVNTAYWSLDLNMMGYGNEIITKYDEGTAFAVIDTGTTMIGIPDDEFKVIRSRWMAQIGDKDQFFNCDEDMLALIGFCQSMLPCSEYNDILDPVTFQMQDTRFEIKPAGYLADCQGHDDETNITVNFCLFGITPMPKALGSKKKMFLFGDSFLRNYYSTYDMIEQSVGLAVDIEAQDNASMYTPANKMIPFAIVVVCAIIASTIMVIFIIKRSKRKMLMRVQVKGGLVAIRGEAQESKKGFLTGLEKRQAKPGGYEEVSSAQPEEDQVDNEIKDEKEFGVTAK